MPGLEGRGAQTRAVRRAGGQVLHEHICSCDEFVEDLASFGCLDVQGQGLLGAVEPDEIAGLTVHGRVVAAGEVPTAGALDLDDPGAEVGQLTGGEGRRDGLFQADDGDARERERKRFGHAPILPGRSPRERAGGPAGSDAGACGRAGRLRRSVPAPPGAFRGAGARRWRACAPLRAR